MNTLILNREFKLPDDGWYQVAPLGEFPVVVEGPDKKPTRLVQVVDAEALQAMCNRFAAAAKRPNFPGILVDFDHFSTFEDKPSEAAGWVTALENRAEGLFAQIRWTDVGEAAVKGGRYRLVSPVFSKNSAVKLGGDKVRPTALIGVALTNEPNMKGMEPLSNRESGKQKSEIEFRRGTDASVVNREQKNERQQTMKSIATMLGLAAEASEEAILAEVTKLKNRAETSEQANEPLKNRVKSLEADNQKMLEAQVEQDLEKFKNRIKPEKRDGWKAALLANRASALELLEGIAEAAPANNKGADQPLLNRAGTKTPAKPGAGKSAGEQSRLLNRAVADYQAIHKCSYEQAWEAVRREKPEMFAEKQEAAE